MTKTAFIASIRADACIGCGKCIPACPVDAIIGAHKYMHVVIAPDCIGCELCVAPCPVDCIDMLPSPLPTKAERLIRAEQAKLRYKARQSRLLQQKVERTSQTIDNASSLRKAAIAAAVERMKNRRTL